MFNSALLPFISGFACMFLTELLKKIPAINAKVAVVVLSVAFGGIYYAFSNYVPENLRIEATNFVLGTLGFAVVIYDFLWKIAKEVKINNK